MVKMMPEATRAGPFNLRLLRGGIAGIVAIALNSIALKAADWVPLSTAHGGLLRLLVQLGGIPLALAGVADIWRRLGLPTPDTQLFQWSFHAVIGMAMAQMYVLGLKVRLPGSATAKGVIYATTVWLINAVIVLPLVGEGFAGSRDLSCFGIAWFAAAHTLFFLSLAWVDELLCVALRFE
ncbi:hypothetical protein GNZ12_24465 [Paraburkholderia sp. 1N]|uniref:Uncharacterized protein n=1 Tax=Paraburkholderia solitsugae TaxID=2675748 RepID=A0ABX2BWY4_9BURK|nr:hypothetical protein [Paraburkholderia solitsugae]NPT44408.1 hypothetical protein [Paraburkholderia solitsugae]